VRRSVSLRSATSSGVISSIFVMVKAQSYKKVLGCACAPADALWPKLAPLCVNNPHFLYAHYVPIVPGQHANRKLTHYPFLKLVHYPSWDVAMETKFQSSPLFKTYE
jgi:hypothetical protein